MKKGKSRNKRKKTRSRLLWIAIAVIGIAAVISAVSGTESFVFQLECRKYE